MNGKYRIFYITPEVTPFTDASNTANISGTLPRILKNLGHDVRVMMPKYRSINERKYVLRDVIRLKDMQVEFAGNKYSVNAKSAFLPDSKVQIYFIDHPLFAERDGIYHESNGKPIDDNPIRFSLFSHGCIETLRYLHWQPDFIICNAWPALYLPMILKSELANDEFFQNTKVVYCEHEANNGYDFSQDAFTKAGLNEYDLLNAKPKITIDALSTELSRVTIYSYEQKSKDRPGKYIPHGVDYQDWNPELDDKINTKYTSENIEEKVKNKEAIADKLGIDLIESTPFIHVILPDDQFNEELANKILQGLNKKKVTAVVTGGHTILSKEHNLKSVTLVDDADIKLLHQLFAASDVFVLLATEAAEIESELLKNINYGQFGVLTDSVYQSLRPEIINFLKNSNLVLSFQDESYDAFESRLQELFDKFQDNEAWNKEISAGMNNQFSLIEAGETYSKIFDELKK